MLICGIFFITGLCLILSVVRGHLGANISRRRSLLLLVAGSFYVAVGIFFFLLSIIQPIYDDVMLVLYPEDVTVTARVSNASDYCGEQKSFRALIPPDLVI